MFNLFDSDEYLIERTILEKTGEKISIEVHDETARGATIPYFKAYKSAAIPHAGSKVKTIRLHFLDSGCEVHHKNNDESIWKIDNKDSKKIRKVLLADNKAFNSYTNWQVACFFWNVDGRKFVGYHYDEEYPENMDRYFAGEYDDASKDAIGYVPSYTEIPDKWVYGKPGRKLRFDEEVDMLDTFVDLDDYEDQSI